MKGCETIKKKIAILLMMLPLLFTNISNQEVQASTSKFHITKNQIIDILDNGTDIIKNYTFEELANDYVEFKEDAYDLTLGLISRNHGVKADTVEEILNNGKIMREYLETIDGALEDILFTTGVWAMTGSLKEALAHLQFRYYEPKYTNINILTSLPYMEIYYPEEDKRYSTDLASIYRIYEAPIGFSNMDISLGKYAIQFTLMFPEYEEETWKNIPTFLQAHDLGFYENEISFVFDRPVKEISDDVFIEFNVPWQYGEERGWESYYVTMSLPEYDLYQFHKDMIKYGYADEMPPPRELYRALPTNNPNELRVTVNENVTEIVLNDPNGYYAFAELERLHVLTETQNEPLSVISSFSSTSTERIEPKLGEPASADVIPIPEENRPPEEENDPSPEDGDSSWWNPLNWLWNLLKSLLEKIGEIIVNALNLLGELLSGLLEGILNILNSILGFFSKIWDWLTWNESGYLQNKLTNIRDTFSSKFPSIDTLFPREFLEDSEAPKIAINLNHYGIGEQEIVNLNYMQQYFPTFKKWITAFLYLSTTIIVYKKITGDGVND